MTNYWQKKFFYCKTIILLTQRRIWFSWGKQLTLLIRAIILLSEMSDVTKCIYVLLKRFEIRYLSSSVLQYYFISFEGIYTIYYMSIFFIKYRFANKKDQLFLQRSLKKTNKSQNIIEYILSSRQNRLNYWWGLCLQPKYI